jgi:hypothetical protein
MLHRHVQTWQTWLHQPSERSQIFSILFNLSEYSLFSTIERTFSRYEKCQFTKVSKLFDLLFKKTVPELPWLFSVFNTLMCVHSHAYPFKAFVFTLGFPYSPFHDNNNIHTTTNIYIYNMYIYWSSKNCLELNCQKEKLDFPCSSLALESNWFNYCISGGEQM